MDCALLLLSIPELGFSFGLVCFGFWRANKQPTHQLTSDMYILHAAYVTQWPLAQSNIHIWLLILYNLCGCYIIEIKKEKKQQQIIPNYYGSKRKLKTHMHTWLFRSIHKWDGRLAETNRNIVFFFYDQVFNQVCKMNVCAVQLLRRWFISLKFLFIFLSNFKCFTFFYCSFISSSDSKSKILHKSIRQQTHTHKHQFIIPFAMLFSIFK